MADMKLQGMSELLRKIEELGRKGSKIENEAIKKAAEPILEDAKSTSAFRDRSGRLRDDLKIGKIKSKNNIKYVTVGLHKGDNSDVFYGKFIEWGTSKMVARPFLQPAYEKNKKRAIEIIKDELRKGLGLK